MNEGGIMGAEKMINSPVNILWTGGWDSTFHLLRLLLEHELPVQPFYLIDETRNSTGIEIQTMDRIRKKLRHKHPRTKAQMRPIRYFGVSDIPPDKEIDDAFGAIAGEKNIGSQYAWLARFCKHHAVSRMSLCIERTLDLGPQQFNIRHLVKDEYEGPVRVTRMDSRHSGTNEYTLFKYFSFPNFRISKQEMLAIARERNWLEEMELTWFCHNPCHFSVRIAYPPAKGGVKACGICSPCIMAIDEGLGWRVPPGRRLLSRLYRLYIKPVIRKTGPAAEKYGLRNLIKR